MSHDYFTIFYFYSELQAQYFKTFTDFALAALSACLSICYLLLLSFSPPLFYSPSLLLLLPFATSEIQVNLFK